MISIVAGIVMGFAATSLILAALGTAGMAVHVVLLVPAVLAGAALGILTARRVDAREAPLTRVRRR
jgi:hypothetical protein